MSTNSPVKLGPYLLFKSLKKGGMARVFLGLEISAPGRTLAIKTLLPKLAGRRLYREMFASEGKIGRQLVHPNIVATVDHGDYDNTPFLAMEFIFGVDLSAVLRQMRQTAQTLPLRLAVSMARDVADGLAYAHELCDDAGRSLEIVNRDVSPGNVMVGFDGVVKLIDFGIAQTTIDVKSQIGSIKGKISYMAPEQVRGLPVDHRADIFSLGTLLYEALTGVHVFQGDGDFATMENARRAEAVPPSHHNAQIDPVLDAIVGRAMAREAYDRYQSARELLEALEGWLAERGGPSSPQSWADFLGEQFGPRIKSLRHDIETARAQALDPQQVRDVSLVMEETPAPAAPQTPAPQNRWLAPVLVGVIAAALGGLAAWWMG